MKKFLKTFSVFFLVILLKELPMLSMMGASANTLNGRIIFFSLISVIAIILLTKKFNYFDGIDLKTFFNKKNISIVIISYVSYIILSAISFKIVEAFSVPIEESTNQVIIEELTTMIKASGLFVFVVIFAPITEEIIFRSIIQDKIFGNKIVGVLISAVLFALVHASDTLIGYLPYFLMGLIFSLSYYFTERIETPIFVHMLNNFIAFIIMLQL